MPISVIILIILFILALFIPYNILTSAKYKVKQSKSGIDIYLNQRFDLIPNLVACVKAYSFHEQSVMEKVTELRSNYVQKQSTNIKEAEILNNALNELMCVSENNPDLKANEQYLKLQKSLIKLESQLQAARRIYNNDVTNYNIKLKVFPLNLIATIFRFKEEPLFTIENFKRENIDIDRSL